jgi:predicted transcriptional regulator
MARGQGKVTFWDDQERIAQLNKLAEKERRTKTTLLHEALDLLFASRENVSAAERFRREVEA